MIESLPIVGAARIRAYDDEVIGRSLPDDLFRVIEPGHKVVLKPNWVMESHKYDQAQWEQVITHPALITAVLRKVIARLQGRGRVSIIDSPTTEASFRKLIARYPVDAWRELAPSGIELEIIDLRDLEHETLNDLVVGRRPLPGDPRGKTELDLTGPSSEFHGHRRSVRGYYGADYDLRETNRAHDGRRNRYSVSRTVLEADVFVNLPKLKTHRKAGITCCLKNLVGINTYKNFLPHHSEGGPADGGDQFPTDAVNSRVEGALLAFLKRHVFGRPSFARAMSSLNPLGRRVFGDTREVIRSGNWYGNDTIWRMILDLNKVLLYGEPDGSLREATIANRKRYIGIVDAIVAGEGHGPLAPDRVDMGYVLWGTSAVAIDYVAATLMGFDPAKIPAIARAFNIAMYPVCSFSPGDVRVAMDERTLRPDELRNDLVVPCVPQFGWKGHIEANCAHASAER